MLRRPHVTVEFNGRRVGGEVSRLPVRGRAFPTFQRQKHGQRQISSRHAEAKSQLKKIVHSIICGAILWLPAPAILIRPPAIADHNFVTRPKSLIRRWPHGHYPSVSFAPILRSHRLPSDDLIHSLGKLPFEARKKVPSNM
jgi:hypothetical protein